MTAKSVGDKKYFLGNHSQQYWRWLQKKMKSNSYSLWLDLRETKPKEFREWHRSILGTEPIGQ